MSNYLQLVNKLRRECAVSGADAATLSGQSAEYNRLAGWINLAWIDIQEIHDDWFFLRQPFAFSTVAQQFSYTPTQAQIVSAPGLGDWKRDSVRSYSPALGYGNEMIMPFIDYDTFLMQFQYGSMRTTYTRPSVFSIDPQRNIVFGAVPDTVYNIVGEYYQAASELVADADIPILPTRYHNLIVYRAMVHYGMFEVASEVIQRGQAEFDKMMLRLVHDQLPRITFGDPLA